MAQKVAFFAPSTAEIIARQSSRGLYVTYTRAHHSFLNFPYAMFVPSLSW